MNYLDASLRRCDNREGEQSGRKSASCIVHVNRINARRSDSSHPRETLGKSHLLRNARLGNSFRARRTDNDNNFRPRRYLDQSRQQPLRRIYDSVIAGEYADGNEALDSESSRIVSSQRPLNGAEQPPVFLCQPTQNDHANDCIPLRFTMLKRPRENSLQRGTRAPREPGAATFDIDLADNEGVY